MKINVSKSELMECIENAVQKVVDERKHNFDDGAPKRKMAPSRDPKYKDRFDSEDDDEDFTQNYQRRKVAESKQPRRRKK